MWTIQGTATYETSTGSITRQIPTFFLDESVQGIVDKNHAIRIAKGMLNPFALPDITLHVYAAKSFNDPVVSFETLTTPSRN
jgi:hypothetical protein